MAEVRVNMTHADNVDRKVINVDPKKLGAISFYLVYDHLVPKYAELPAKARDIIGIKELGKHLDPPVVLWRA